jgi:hypothetical protein
MPALSLVGPSSPLRTSIAEVRRIVNWEPMRIESSTGQGGAGAFLKQIAGLIQRTMFGSAIRAMKVSQGRLFAATSGQLVEIMDDWSAISWGAIADGLTSIDDNETQLGIVANGLGFAFDLSTNVISSITDNWPGSTSINVLDGIGVLTPPGSNHFYLTSVQDFTVLDALDFASADSSPGNIVAALVKHRQLLLLKDRSGEVWYDSGDATFPFARDDSAVIEVGCAASRSLCKVAGVYYWLGQDEDGNGFVYGMPGYVAQRISSDALEEQLATISDLSGATAWVYQQEGQARYVLNVPGLSTTWVYNVAAGIWHERAEWVDGDWAQWRATCHAFAFGRHLVGDATGRLYELDPLTNTFAGDPQRRLWRSPHNAAPTGATESFGSFQVLCDVGLGLPDGTAPTMLLRYSNDGAKTWESWSELSLGAAGEFETRVRDTGLGSAIDRVWEFVVTDDVRCNVMTAIVNER